MTPHEKWETVQRLIGGDITTPDLNDLSTYNFNDGQTPPTEEAIQAKLKELQAEYDAQAYARKREAEYPSIQECVHAILDNTLDALQAKRA